MQNNQSNIIDAIEDRLKQLEREKDEIEKLYGIDEYLANEFKITKNEGRNILDSKISANKNSVFKSKSNLNNFSATAYNNVSLPKLEVTQKKELKTLYKTPETLQDSLKYEPNIKDLLDENDFEPSFANLNSMKTSPFIPKGSNLNNYLKVINEDFVKNYIN